ncbi:MAG: hypothetical protein JSU95_06920 [Betaproteobacteria bacterium]|nr:MAG: hypothetical protein JSU95_06920 [Betaproteobacteria bacterium]
MKRNVTAIVIVLAALLLPIAFVAKVSAQEVWVRTVSDRMILAQHNLEQAQQDWPDLQLLTPDKVRGLSDKLRADLGTRGCRIPMFTKWDGRHNVIRGAFLHAGSQDVAVLCLVEDDMSIIVYPEGGVKDVQQIRKFPADAYRMIHAVSPFVLKKRAIRDQATERLPEFDHDGIEDGPVGERTETTYFHAGNWINAP